VTGWLFGLDVAGHVPVPQGSKRIGRHRGTGRPLVLDDNRNLEAWRALVAGMARKEWNGRPPITVPVSVWADFYLPRPAGHFGTGRNAGKLKDSAPVWPAVKPDGDKLLRAVFDSLTTAGVWKDDSLAVVWSGAKHYADALRRPGVSLQIRDMEVAG
jgi:Holliday junction resolvase RusA-like endonuclease